MRAKMWIQRATFSPAALDAGETTALFNIAEGTRVWAASYRVKQNAASSTDTTVTLGDGDDADGLIAAIDTETATAAAGAGAYLAASGGKLYAAADTIDAVYAEGTTEGATFPIIEFTIHCMQEWP